MELPTATAAALFGLDCTIYMGKIDTERQALNVARMRLLGAEVIAVESGTQTLKDAMNDALRDWVASVDNTHYLIGTVAGPHPFPMLVREFQRVISTEAKAQLRERYGRLPDAVAACVGGGSNALGIFADFIPDPEVALYGFEAGGEGIASGRHAATISAGRNRRIARDAQRSSSKTEDGQTKASHSISAGLDYPGVGPEHSWLAEVGRAEYLPITDAEAMEAFRLLSRTEGIVPAIESAHALAGALTLGPRLSTTAQGKPPLILVNLSGRGDKDVDTAITWFGLDTTVRYAHRIGPVAMACAGARRTGTGAEKSEHRPRTDREAASPDPIGGPRSLGGLPACRLPHGGDLAAGHHDADRRRRV